MHIELMSGDLCVNFPRKLIDFHHIEFILLLSWYFCGVFVVTGILILSLNNPYFPKNMYRYTYGETLLFGNGR